MNLPTTYSVSRASLPQTYQAAQAALAQCSQVDECKDWADKAAALASYARQSEDQELERMAQRIRARAIRRSSEILNQIETAQGSRNDLELVQGPLNKLTRKQAADEAGMSRHQYGQAMAIGKIPEQDFEAQVESDKPPTLSQLAAQGTKTRENIVDLKGRDPKEFNRAMNYVAAFERVAKDLEGESHDAAISILDEKERARLRAAIKRVDAITDKVATRI